MKKIFILSLISLFLSCSSSEDDNNIPANQTFLENYENIVWVNIEDNDDETYYRYFKNDLNTPDFLFHTSYYSDDCYELSYRYITPEIIENNSTTLILKYFYRDQEYYIVTYTINDNKLTVEGYEHYFDNVYISNSTYVETYTNIEDYVFCENDDIE